MMWKLMKLEWKKNNLKKYIVKAAAVTVILFLLLFMTSGELESKETVEIYGQSMIYAAIKMFADSYFILCTLRFKLPLCLFLFVTTKSLPI